MLREDTEFIGNAIGIDPIGCGCTDCIVGNSMPEDDYNIDELIKAHLDGGRKIVNRTSGTIIMYKTGSGDYKMDSVGSTNVSFIPEGHSSEDEDKYDDVLHTSDCSCDGCDYYKTSFPISETTRLGYTLDYYFEGEKTLLNWTGYTLLVYKTWDDSYVVQELDLSFDRGNISIISND